MKRLMVLMLVLGLTSVAGAKLQISVRIPAQPGINVPIDYGYNPPDSQIFLLPSQIAILDIGTDIVVGGEGGIWALTCQTTCGLITGGVIVIEDPDWVIILDTLENMGINGLPQGEGGIAGAITNFGHTIPAGTIYDEIMFHCESPNGPTVITLWKCTDEATVIGVWDTVTIHQIPEPASMLLLGLGGLTMRRINRRERKER